MDNARIDLNGLLSIRGKTNELPKAQTLQFFTGIIFVISLIVFRIVWPVYQYGNVQTESQIRIIYISSMLLTLILVPVTYVMCIVSNYSFYKKIRKLTNDSFGINEKDLLIGIVIPFVQILYLCFFIYQVEKRILIITSRSFQIDRQKQNQMAFTTILYSLLQSFMIYHLNNRLRKALMEI